MSNGFWGNMWISCFFIATFHQIAVYSLCLGRSWILIHLMLKFICGQCGKCITCQHISKHLMLKFISCRSRQPLLFNHFKTSHVKVYLYGSPLLSSLATNFKTSHVKVYRQSYSTKQLCTLISKHLMLKFILQVDIFFWYLFKFQNIPC